MSALTFRKDGASASLTGFSRWLPSQLDAHAAAASRSQYPALTRIAQVGQVPAGQRLPLLS